MKAAQITQYGPGQVLIEVHASSINPADSKIREGAFQVLRLNYLEAAAVALTGTSALQAAQLLAREVEREGHIVHVRPALIVEIAIADGVIPG